MVTRTWVATHLGQTSTIAEISWLDDDGTPQLALSRIDPDAVPSLADAAPVSVYTTRAFGETEATIAAGVPYRKREGAREIIVGVALSLGGLALLLRAGIAEPRRRWLLARGTAVAARVVRSRRRGREVEYEFDAGGSRIRGAELLSATQRKWMAASPREGDVAYVVFDPARPFRCALWGFSRPSAAAFRV
jgi:hypothetical protein